MNYGIKGSCLCAKCVSYSTGGGLIFLTLLKYFTACPRTMYNSTCLVNCFTGAYSFDKAKRNTCKNH